MDAPLPFVPSGRTRAVADLVAAVASRDECALLVGEADAVAAVLDRAGRELPRHRVRCVRVSASSAGVLVLSGLVAQVVGRSGAGALTDADLKAGFLALTDPGEGHDRVALLVEGAQALSPPALRYLQFVCRSGPRLRLVFAGRPGLDAVLAGAEFARLRRLFTCRLNLSGPAADGLLLPFPPAPASPGWGGPPEARIRHRSKARVLAEPALVATLALLAWMTWQADAPVPPGTAPRVHVPVEGGAKEALAVEAIWQAKAPPIRPEADDAPVDDASADDTPGPAERALAEQGRAGETPPLAPGTAVRSVEAARNDAGAVRPLRQAGLPAPANAEPSALPTRATAAPAGMTTDGRGVEVPAHPVAPSPPKLAAAAAGSPVPALVMPSFEAAPPKALHTPHEGAALTADALVVATAPAGGADERRCRDAVLKVLLGKAASDADKRFLRGGCHAE